MPLYVDGFLIPMPKKNLPAYRRIAQKAGKIWRELGAQHVLGAVRNPHACSLFDQTPAELRSVDRNRPVVQ